MRSPLDKNATELANVVVFSVFPVENGSDLIFLHVTVVSFEATLVNRKLMLFNKSVVLVPIELNKFVGVETQDVSVFNCRSHFLIDSLRKPILPGSFGSVLD